ncbi:MAG: hypothetical protein HQ503_06895, partial [Rhodospirillales bacterium]|nr:hypothetical protein [Rhodospirillales bacterium]
IVFVFADGRVRPARVEIGESFANKFEIKSGLSVGQKIVVRGNELLRPGQTVRVSGGGASGRPNGTPAGPPAGAPGGSPLAALPPEKRRAFFQGLTPEDRQKFFAMSPEDKRNFVQSRIGANK